MHHGNAADILKNPRGMRKPASHAARQVHLRDVPGDDGTRTKTDTRQKHLHLLDGRVLGFIKNHKRVIERSASHIRQRRNFNHLFFNEALRLFKSEEIKKRVVKRS